MRTGSGPNLFSVATSELSQDAFLTWFLLWADPSYSSINPYLHEQAQRFISWLHERAGVHLPRYKSVTLKRQFKRIDVFVTLSSAGEPDRHILIEDKTFTRDSKDQINRYLQAIRDEGIEGDVVSIYLKSWVEEPRSVPQALAQIYLSDLASFVQGIDLKHANSEILSNWCEYILARHASTERFKEQGIHQWQWDQWHGFFNALSHHPSITPLQPGYGYVPNQSGGFIGCWMGWEEHPEVDQTYLQIDAYPGKLVRLTFRLAAKSGSKVTMAQARGMFNAISNLSTKYGLSVKPSGRFQTGKSSCFAILEGHVLAPRFEDMANMKQAIETVLKSHALLKECSMNLKKPV